MVGVALRFGTLLGPEGSGESSSLRPFHSARAGRGRLGEGGPTRVERPRVLEVRDDQRDRHHPFLENCTVDASINILCGQVNKGARWMPWHQEPMKDVGGCEKPRGAANRAVIRGFPNGETRQESCPVTLT